MNKPSSLLLAIALFSCAGVSRAADGFSAVRCTADIPKALIGRTMANEPVAATEQRHRDLGLKDLGGGDVGERLFVRQLAGIFLREAV